MTVIVRNGEPPVALVVELPRPLVIIPGTTAATAGGAVAPSDFVQVFSTPLSTWNIQHNLGRKVDVALFTMGGVKMLGEVIRISDNVAVANFAQPTAGMVRVI